MLPASLMQNRYGTATIEFALILPIMVLLVLGLADTVRRNLAMIDVDAAVHEGADAALRYGFDSGRIRAAMATTTADISTDSVDLVECEAAKGGKYRDDRKRGWKSKRRKPKKPKPSNSVAADSSCGEWPAGRYVEVIASTEVPSLFGPAQSPTITATATVRLP